MGKIVIRGEFPIKPGKTEQGKAAARVLRERVQREETGVILYEFFMNASNTMMAITEMYIDEPSLMSHIDTSDFTQLFETLDFADGKVQVHGNPSAALLKKFDDIIGPVEIFLPI